MHDRPTIRQRHRVRLAVVVVASLAVVVVGGGAGVRWWLTRPPDRVTVGDAIGRYRTESSPAPAPAVAMPAPGVYSYATTGSESVDALGGDSHTYGSPTAMTVEATACGYETTWNPLEGRQDVTDLCSVNGGWQEAGATNVHEFFHISQAAHFACDGVWWVPPPGTTEWHGTCQGDDRTTDRSARVVGTESVDVGGRSVTALHVRIDDVVSGSSTGTSANDLWLDPRTALPLRETIESQTGNDTPLGRVTFHERIELVLQSLTPGT